MEATSDAYRETGLWQFFSFEGRVRRMTYWINALICGVIAVMAYVMFVDISVSPYTLETSVEISSKPIYFLVIAIIGLRQLSVSVRRWHDLDKSGWWAITGFAPMLNLLNPGGSGVLVAVIGGIASLYALGMCGFVPGDSGANTYGLEPEEGQWL
jgi:uncharacterized membrane protein YhaH (DUF805 family)